MTIAHRVLPHEHVHVVQRKKIFDTLASHCYDFYKPMFEKTDGESEKDRIKRWGVFNDALRKMLFGNHFHQHAGHPE